jgi:hypothetical protein
MVISLGNSEVLEGLLNLNVTIFAHFGYDLCAVSLLDGFDRAFRELIFAFGADAC